MKPRIIILFLALLGAAALRSVQTPESESHEASLAGEVSEPLATARSGTSVEKPTRFESMDSRARQRERLRDTAARLAVRRGEAKANGAPEATIGALDAHLERVELQLSALGVDASTEASVADMRSRRALLSPGSDT